MNAAEYLKENREQIIAQLNAEISRKIIVCGRAATDLRGAMMVYKESFEQTGMAWKAKEEAEKAINGNIKVRNHLLNGSMNQRPSFMR